MHHHLGSLLLQHDLSDLLRSLTRRDPLVDRGASFVERLQQLQLAARQTTDLLEALRDEPGPDFWAFEFAAALGARTGMQLTQCRRETGLDDYLGIAVLDRTRTAAVRPGDLVCAGVAALRRDGGEVEVMPRVYRKICSNGAVVLEGDGADLLQECGSIAAAVDCALSPATAEASFALLRAAAQRRAQDPVGLLRLAGVPIVPARVWAEREEDDDSVFGVVNALTAHARREPRLDRRLQLERGAARILATLGQHADGSSEPSAERCPVLA